MTKIERNVVIPNIITSINMLLGFLSIIESLKGNFISASWFIIVAILMDGLDGKTARLLNGFSEFGKEFDSFCDAISFGMAPAMLLYSILTKIELNKEFLFLDNLNFPAIPISFIFLLCGILRLVKFNVITVASNEKKDFSGMPIPTGAGLLATYIVFSSIINKKFFNPSQDFFIYIDVLLIMALLNSVLMVSTIPFRTIPRTFYFLGKKGILIVAVIILATGKYSFFPFGLVYFGLNIYNFLRKAKLPNQNCEEKKEENDIEDEE